LLRVEAAAERVDATADISGLLRECAFDEATLREAGLLEICRSGLPVTLEALPTEALLWIIRLTEEPAPPPGGHRAVAKLSANQADRDDPEEATRESA
jgi:hypothetical protein